MHTRKHTSLPHAQDSVAQGWNKGTKKDVEPNHIKIFVFRKDKRTQEDSARDHRDNLNVKNQFNPRRPQDRQLTNERVSSLINHIIQNIPSTCALYSIGHTKDDSLPELLLNFFMSSEEMKGNLLRPSVLTLYEMRIFMSRTHSTESTSLKISIETPLETLPQVLYPNTRTNVGLWCLSWVFCWLDTGRPPFLSCSMSELNLTWNFVPKTILHCFTSHLYCHACWGTGKFFNCLKCKEVILD